MIKKITVSLLFAFVFLLMANQAGAHCVDNGTSVDYEPHANADAYDHCDGTALIDYYCVGNGVGETVHDCTRPDGLGYCSGNSCKVYDCVKDSQCGTDSSECGEKICNFSTHTCILKKQAGLSCNGGNGECHGGVCLSWLGVGQLCKTSPDMCGNNSHCGATNSCVCDMGWDDCADQPINCGCNWKDDGKECKKWYNSDKGRIVETCEYANDGDGGIIAPSLTFIAVPSIITIGDPIVLSYTVGNNAKACTASATPITEMANWSGWKNFLNETYSTYPVTDPRAIKPTTTGIKTYTISCSNAGGTRTISKSVTVNPVSLPPLPCTACSDENDHCRGSYVDKCGATCTGKKDCAWREVTP